MNEIYDTFLKTADIYDANFPMREYILKDKDIKFPWICKGLKKSTKTKQRLYIKFLKTAEDESNYRNYKSLFEKLKKKLKQPIIQNCCIIIEQILSGCDKL